VTRVEREATAMIEKRARVFVTIQHGRGQVCEETVPDGVEVEILNFDLLAADPASEIPWWSEELKEYWLINHREWGRCGRNCPCARLGEFDSYRARASS
jgi:hypothetical protein